MNECTMQARPSAYRSYCCTVRPRNGICDDRLKLYKIWAEKQLGCYGVIEGQDETRHLHMQVWLENPRERGDVNTALVRIFKRLDYEDNELKVLRRGTRIAYNDGFVDSYLDKGGTVVFDNKPENTSEFYPTIEEQERVQNRSHAVDPYFHDLDEEYIKWGQEEEISDFLWYEDFAIQFLAYKMFEARTMKVVRDRKQRRQLGICLAAYHSRNINVDLDSDSVKECKRFRKLQKSINKTND